MRVPERTGDGPEKLPRSPILRFGALMARRYSRHNVAIQSAALAFYLLFTIFPLLIFISALLGLLELDVAGILTALGDFLPAEVLGLIEMYLTYVRGAPSPQLMLFGLVFTIYFPMRAANALMRAVRTAYHLGAPKRPMTHWLRVLVFTVALIVSIAVTLALMTFGERALWYAVKHFRLPAFLAVLWVRLRFPVVGVVGFLALCLLYEVAQDRLQPWRNIWPGVAVSLAAWMGISWLYAYYADHLSHYSALYGSIGAIIVVLVWLNLTAVTLILGAEFNGVLIRLREERQG